MVIQFIFSKINKLIFVDVIYANKMFSIISFFGFNQLEFFPHQITIHENEWNNYIL